MKRFILGTALLVSTFSVYAQSSVTLYGLVDDALAFNSNVNGKREYFLANGAAYSNRWGLNGTEDLGGGLAAIFGLEAGFSVNSGAGGNGGALFGRRAIVGLTGDFGTVTVGRQMSAARTYVGPMTSGGSWAFNGIGYGVHPGDVDNLDSFKWINNSIIYTTPTVKGLTGSAMYSLGGVPGSVAEHQIWAVGAGYVNGSLKLAVGYQVANQPNFSFYGVDPSASSTGNNMFSPVNQGYASAGAFKIFAAGATYTVGRATVGAVYTNTRYIDLGATAVKGLSPTEAAYRGSEVFNIGELNFKYMLTPALLLGVSYTYTRSSGVNSARYQQVDLGFAYAITKPTQLYGGVIYQHAAGTNSLGLPAVAQIGPTSPSSSNQNQTVVLLGITHRF